MFKRRKNRIVKSQSDYTMKEEKDVNKEVSLRKESAHRFASAQDAVKTRGKGGIMQTIRKVRLSISKDKLKEDAGVTGDISMTDLIQLHGGDEVYTNKPPHLAATTDSIVLPKREMNDATEMRKKIPTRSLSEAPSNKSITKPPTPFKVDYNISDCDDLDKLLDEFDSESSHSNNDQVKSTPQNSIQNLIVNNFPNDNHVIINNPNVDNNNNNNNIKSLGDNNLVNNIRINNVQNVDKLFERQPSDEIPTFIKNLKNEFKLDSPRHPKSSFSNLEMEMEDRPHDNELIIDRNEFSNPQIVIANENFVNVSISDIDKLLSEITTGNDEDDQRLLHIMMSNENIHEVDIDELLTF